jgi:hypothetical protein
MGLLHAAESKVQPKGPFLNCVLYETAASETGAAIEAVKTGNARQLDLDPHHKSQVAEPSLVDMIAEMAKDEDDGMNKLKIALLVTKSSPIVIATSHSSFTDPGFVKKLHAKGIDKFIAYPLPWDLAKERYGGHFDVALKDLHEQDDLRVLDFDGERVFGLFHLNELGTPVMSEGSQHKQGYPARRRFTSPSHILALNASEIVGLMRAQTSNVEEAQDFYVSAWKEYIAEEEFDRNAYDIHDGADYDLVTALVTLTFEPYVGLNRWILTVVVESQLGPVTRREEEKFARTELTLDEFEAEVKSSGKKRITVRLDAETPLAKRHFHQWLADVRARYARHPAPVGLR